MIDSHPTIMAEQILQQGILDVKVPRGSEERKLWKVWCRQWITFSVVYPSGRKEPYLVLGFAHSSTEASERQIEIPRDGLRLFRCWSTSRPYRTWAIMSSNKPLLYFAAESEARAQEWMQVIRDGLWPPCLSSQMLAACNHEVSLMDDENTFQSGLLGVYGKLVMTSKDVISLIHPYWGSTLLQISLNNIQDVYLVREGAVSAAGVFRIVLKCCNSNIRALRFYSATAANAMQWILSKVLTEDVSKNKEPLKPQQPESNAKENLPEHFPVNFEKEHNASTLNQQCTAIQMSTVPINSEYANVECLVSSSNQNDYLSLEIPIHDSITPQSLASESLADVKVNEKLALECHVTNFNLSTDISVLNLNKASLLEPIYENQNIKLTNPTDINTEYESMKFPNTISTLSKSLTDYSNNTLSMGEYPVVEKKCGQNNKPEQSMKTQVSTGDFSTNRIHINKNNQSLNDEERSFNKLGSITQINSLSNFANRDVKISTLDSTNAKTANSPSLLNNLSMDYIKMKSLNANSNLKDVSLNINSRDSNSVVYGVVNKQSSQIVLPGEIEKTKSLVNECTVDNLKKNYLEISSNISGDILNTSIHSIECNNILKSGSASSDEDIEFSQPWLNDLNDSFDNHIYEDLLERKGTIYEEIDEPDDEYVPYLPPELPERPPNLEIPDTLRLQKLSESISASLTQMKSPSPKIEYSRPHLIKKIKEMSRVMQISPSRETVPFSVEQTSPTGSKVPILKPFIRNSYVNAEQNSETKPTPNKIYS